MAQRPQLLKKCLEAQPVFQKRCRAMATSASNADVTTGSIKQLQGDLRSGARSAVEVAKEYLERVAKTEPSVRSFLHVAEESALEQAAAIDRAIEGGKALGPLAGVPIGVKDNICTKGLPSTGGSRILENFTPPYDATAIARLKAAGAVIIGKMNCDEFGMGSSTENSGYHITANPWDLTRVPGGSSGGSAAGVAAGQVMASLGSDTGGSIRQPASFCGVVGLKPTYGLVSRYGLMAYASSLDCIGPLANSVEDAAIVLGAMAGHDEADSTSEKQKVPDYTANLRPASELDSRPLAGVRLGLISETMGEGVDPGVVTAIQAAAAHYEQLGAVVEEVSLPSFRQGLPAYYVLAPSEASSNLSRYDGVRYGLRVEGDELTSMYGKTRDQGFGAEVKRRILMGTYALSAGYYDAFYKRAQQVRTLIQRDFQSVLSKYDALLSPTVPTTAYQIGEKTEDPLSMYVGDIMTVNVNLAGLPALVVPCGLDQGLPVGLQLVGPAFGEAELLRLGHVFEQTNSTWRNADLPELVVAR
ncbi:aspartyl-tRNA(Asn)/glutamyl-tRNA (Gln) amidotransferase subunit A [Klebsormidium nitens]|uniref:Glutamyl-tRNA(Gln) amidotransferase subunit A, chloroplastic/mitochondrial n=1 Tax=Klebsormidium nitens TaxID=105231 RepID=A0A1Y1IK02_KLENI|nr:aspartyl-tRNA(Asn)/glutamyl-tRNA (Gln) amidotransferase subunit A [Klebsormidium nitens]|eukprot:GAQ88468.1 aspartyl-tRNA(Asn)/glutamyl-tRNA (Gln) amidotransferase subunit A [Klebsormidium nitens]